MGLAVFYGDKIEAASREGQLSRIAGPAADFLQQWADENPDRIVHPRTADKIFKVLDGQLKNGKAKEPENWWAAQRSMQYHQRTMERHQSCLSALEHARSG